MAKFRSLGDVNIVKTRKLEGDFICRGDLRMLEADEANRPTGGGQGGDPGDPKPENPNIKITGDVNEMAIEKGKVEKIVVTSIQRLRFAGKLEIVDELNVALDIDELVSTRGKPAELIVGKIDVGRDLKNFRVTGNIR